MIRTAALRLILGPALALSVACRENLSPPTPNGAGADLEGPVVLLRPGQDTTVDPSGILNIRLIATDQSNIVSLNVLFTGGTFSFTPVNPNDTITSVIFPVALAGLSGTTFQFSGRAVDVLNHETVTAPVTVTVR